MTTFEFIAPDGSPVTIEGPEGSTQEQALEKAKAYFANKKEVPTQRGRAALSGLTAGFSDEMVGKGRALVDPLLPNATYDFGGDVSMETQTDEERYKTFRDDERQQLNAYRDDRPIESLGFEVAGGLLPLAATLGGSAVPQAGLRIPQAANMGTRIAKGTAIGGAAGYGYSEEDDLYESAPDIAFGAATGAVADPLIAGLGAAGPVMTQKLKAVGKKPAAAALKELRRLAKATGKPVAELIDDINSGAVLAENKTLTAVVRALKNAGGETADYINKQVPARMKQTKARAEKAISEGLGVDNIGTQNIYRTMREGDEALKALENAEYTQVFDQNKYVTGDVAKMAEGIVQKNVPARKAVQEAYTIDDTIAPLFNEMDNGAIKFNRAPTLQDVEIIRRAVTDQADTAFRAGKGASGQAYKKAEQSLRGLMDDNFPDLKAARANARVRREISSAYEDGRKALGKDVDELAVEMEKMKGPRLKAFRAGVASAVKDRGRKQQNSMVALADQDRQTGAALNTVLPPRSQGPVNKATQVAADSTDMLNKVMYNSMTAPEQAAKAGLSANIPMSVKGLMEDPKRLMPILGTVIRKIRPEVNDEVSLQVAQVLFEQNPELVAKALQDPQAITPLIKTVLGLTGDAVAAQTTNMAYRLEQ